MLAQIDEFLSSSNGYSSNVAVKYYTRDFFLFKRINKALRQQNFPSDSRFSFLSYRYASSITNGLSSYFRMLYDIGDTMEFYRGQRMSKARTRFYCKKNVKLVH